MRCKIAAVQNNIGLSMLGALRVARTGCIFTALAVCGLLPFSVAMAQVTQAPAAQQASPARPTGTVTPKAAPKTVAAKTDASAAPSGDSAMRQRVEQLEEQLVEMQVTVGTLDSLAKGGGSSSSGVYRGGTGGAAGDGNDSGRVAALETQVRALATQVDQLSQQLRQANARNTGGPPSQASVNVATVGPDTSDPIGRLVSNGSGNGSIGSGVVPQGATSTPSLQASAASDASSKQSYEQAYGFLLQQDFAAAETAFDEFLRRYPTDPLAGNAQYWLGETFFARGQFKPAASAFLKVSQTYARSAKAPDSLLKLALSLDKLGARDAACASYADLNAKFPNAPGHVKNRADTERRRLGCS